jgi:poly-gamma-glutamate synthesis protein (capsule biosynthesis protein)
LVTILIGGDVCPIGDNGPYFQRGDIDALFHQLLGLFREADVVIANLECPLIERQTPIAKTGPVFGEPTSCANSIGAAGIDVLCLANNHIMDHGAEGLASTLEACKAAGIATVGAGATLAEAGRIVVRDTNGFRVGVLAMAEHEFSIATRRSPGANPLDLAAYVRNVEANWGSFDYLIVLLHGGPEFLTAPSPRLKDTCHFLVEMGANAVVVQHPHSFGGYETYLGAPIVYGQGALVMDEPIYRDRESFHKGVLVRLVVDDQKATTMHLVPFTQSAPTPGARLMGGEPAAALLRELAAKAKAILDDDFVRAEWQRFCEEEKHGYMSVLLSHNRLLRRLNRGGFLAWLVYRKRRLLGTRNVVLCESHREALETIFKEGMV